MDIFLVVFERKKIARGNSNYKYCHIFFDSNLIDEACDVLNLLVTIDELDSSAIGIYPNPVGETLYIESTKLEGSLFGSFGLKKSSNKKN